MSDARPTAGVDQEGARMFSIKIDPLLTRMMLRFSSLRSDEGGVARCRKGAAMTRRVTADELDHAFTTPVTEHEHAWFLGSLRFWCSAPPLGRNDPREGKHQAL